MISLDTLMIFLCLVCRFIQELGGIEKMKKIVVRSFFTCCKHTIRCEKAQK